MKPQLPMFRDVQNRRPTVSCQSKSFDMNFDRRSFTVEREGWAGDLWAWFVCFGFALSLASKPTGLQNLANFTIINELDEKNAKMSASEYVSRYSGK